LRYCAHSLVSGRPDAPLAVAASHSAVDPASRLARAAALPADPPEAAAVAASGARSPARALGPLRFRRLRCGWPTHYRTTGCFRAATPAAAAPFDRLRRSGDVDHGASASRHHGRPHRCCRRRVSAPSSAACIPSQAIFALSHTSALAATFTIWSALLPPRRSSAVGNSPSHLIRFFSPSYPPILCLPPSTPLSLRRAPHQLRNCPTDAAVWLRKHLSPMAQGRRACGVPRPRHPPARGRD